MVLFLFASAGVTQQRPFQDPEDALHFTDSKVRSRNESAEHVSWKKLAKRQLLWGFALGIRVSFSTGWGHHAMPRRPVRRAEKSAEGEAQPTEL